MTGVQKNLIDWLSRPSRQSAAPQTRRDDGRWRTIRDGARTAALRQVFVFTESYALLKPELMIPSAQQYFDADGRLADEQERQRVAALVEALVAWSRQVALR